VSFLTLRRAAAPVMDCLPGLHPVRVEDLDHAAQEHARASRFAFFGAALLFVLAVQLSMGAFQAEHGLYSDDAAHFMNGLLLRDYLTQAPGSNPVQFAEQYYLNYPKIAPLMWPPLFHVVFGLCLLAGGSPTSTALLLVGLACAWLIFRLHSILERLAGGAAALVGAGLLLTTPMVLVMSSVVMLDVIIAAFSLEAAYWLAQYFRSLKVRHAAVFGIFAALACLTKGNGVAVVLIPPVLIVLAGRYDLLRRSGLYVAALIVLVFAVPILSFSATFDARIGDFGPVTAQMVLSRLVFYGGHLLKNLGGVVVTLGVAGAVVTVLGSRARSRDDLPLAEALVALAVSGLLFHLLNPHSVSVSRYMTMVLAPVIALAMVAVHRASEWIDISHWRRSVLIAGMAILLVTTTVSRVRAVPLSQMGYRSMIGYLAREGHLAGARVLVVSDEFGEGAAVTEAALHNVQPAPIIVRGSKLLADGGWGDNGAVTHASSAAVMQHLEDLHIDYIVLDRSSAAKDLPYFKQVADVVENLPARVREVAISPPSSPAGSGRPLELYQVRNRTPGQPAPLRMNLSQTLGRTLQR